MSARIDIQQGVYNSPDIENKTNKNSNSTDPGEQRFVDQSKQEIVNSLEKNILNQYRSFTYNWTIAGLKKDYLENPKLLRESELEYVIVKSGGKGTAGISDNVVGIDKKVGEEVTTIREGGRILGQTKKDIIEKDYGAKDLVSGFNQNSPGRFDMYIDNVEISSTLSFTKKSNVSMPTKIKFDIFEPYSVNGFIEALFITAKATGYPSYIQANFVLKLEFKGYNDNEIFSDPEVIPKATRYFPFTFTNIEVDITDRGTRYKCEAIPANEKLFGEANTIKKPIKAEGNTVKEIVNSFIFNLNTQTLRAYKEANPNQEINPVDVYSVKFKNFDEQKGWYDDPNHPLATSNFVKILLDNNLYKMEDPGSTTQPTAYKAEGAAQQNSQPTPQEQAKNPDSTKLTPNKSVIHIAEKSNVHEVLSAIIRDSEYTKNLIKNLGKAPNSPDQFGMVDYFMVRIETTLRAEINQITKKPAQDITYVISPYKIHFTELPLYSDSLIDESKLKKLSLREYNYIYTGQNYDVLNFRLNFNTLFFEALPAAMGNNKNPGAQHGLSNDNAAKIQTEGSNLQGASDSQIPLPPKKPEVIPVQAYGGNASQPLDDPYSKLARQMHESIVNSKASMIDGKLEILGDPLYLVTGGIGNYNPTPSESRGVTVDGEANQLYSQVLITINFRNPIDIMPLSNGGTMFFDGNRVPFSGSYQVLEVLSTFREGTFKQVLEVLRVPGQILDYSVKPTNISQLVTEVADPVNQVKPSSSRANSPSQRIDTSSITEQLDRGIPNSTDNFTNVSGGLGGNDIFDNFGIDGRTESLLPSSSLIGSSLPEDVSSNIRLFSNNLTAGSAFMTPKIPKINPQSLFDIAKGNVDLASSVAAASNVLKSNLPRDVSTNLLADGLNESYLNSFINKSNIGSGIGEGASVFIKNVEDSKYAVDSVLGAAELNNNLDTNTLNSVASIGSRFNNLVNTVENKISSFAGSSADPNALAAKSGIDPSRISGVDRKLQSKILGQISNLAQSIPEGVNLEQAVSSGLAFNYLSSDKVQNIPATAPYARAPVPMSAPDEEYIKTVTAKKGIKGLTDLFGTSSVSRLSNNFVPRDIVNSVISNPTNAELNPYKHVKYDSNRVDDTIFKNKLDTGNKLLRTPQIQDSNKTNSVGNKFGSVLSRSSPLDKLINKLNDPDAPPYTGTDPIIRKRLGLPPLN